MAKALSPIRIARIRRTNVANATETQELDFSFGLRQGIEIHAIEFGLGNWSVAGADPPAEGDVTLSLHAETGALEVGINGFPADDFILNSEIIAEAVFASGKHYDNATQASHPSGQWLTEKSWRFHSLIGGPLLLAQNLVFRAIASANFSVNGPQALLYYRYVELSTAELAEQFALRR